MTVDPGLKKYATPKQAVYLDAVNECGSVAKAAKKLGIAHQVVSASLLNLKRKAAKYGYAPECDMTHEVPDTFMVKGVSTLYNDEGKVVSQWVKSTVDHQKTEMAMREAITAMAEGLPRVKPVKSCINSIPDLCNLYTITDYHVGMRSWGPETGIDWDLDIAERTLISVFQHLVENSPKAEIGIVNQLGDFLHFDSLAPITPTAGNLLDADSRYAKVVKVATKILRLVVDMALRRHQKVIVLIAEGNHDMASSVWLRHLFAMLYENEPRVEVIGGEMPYYVYRHGETMLGFHHGHLTKNEKLPLIFAARFADVWGGTKKRYVHVGHRHHVDEKEHPGMKVIQHPTLAAADAYASRHGYDSEREITAITYHAKFGQVARTTVCPEMIVHV